VLFWVRGSPSSKATSLCHLDPQSCQLHHRAPLHGVGPPRNPAGGNGFQWQDVSSIRIQQVRRPSVLPTADANKWSPRRDTQGVCPIIRPNSLLACMYYQLDYYYILREYYIFIMNMSGCWCSMHICPIFPMFSWNGRKRKLIVQREFVYYQYVVVVYTVGKI
jgi:hypothetical protein